MTAGLLDEVLGQAVAPSLHITVAEKHYRTSDGKVLITVDGLRKFLHRAAWEAMYRPLDRGEYLIRICDVERCVSPHHYAISRSTAGFTHCPNGHLYGPEDVMGDGSHSCQRCYRDKLERRRTGGSPYWKQNIRKKVCPAGHRYTAANTYVYRRADGRVNRKCKACTLARRHEVEPALYPEVV